MDEKEYMKRVEEAKRQIQGTENLSIPDDIECVYEDTEKSECGLLTDDPEPEIYREETESYPVVGVLTDCLRLNVRSDPSLNSEIVAVLEADAKVSTRHLNNDSFIVTVNGEDWVAVETDDGIEGFCMAKYISFR